MYIGQREGFLVCDACGSDHRFAKKLRGRKISARRKKEERSVLPDDDDSDDFTESLLTKDAQYAPKRICILAMSILILINVKLVKLKKAAQTSCSR